MAVCRPIAASPNGGSPARENGPSSMKAPTPTTARSSRAFPCLRRFTTLRNTDPAHAREIQKRVSDQFLENFSKGLAVTGFERTPEAGHIFIFDMAFQIDRIVLRQIQMPLVHFFETSFGRTYKRDIVLVEVTSDGLSGYGEITAGENPFYNEEWTDSAWLIARDYAAPRVLKHSFDDASQVADRTSHIRGHLMARGGVEVAVWDLEARRKGVSLAKLIGGGARTAEIACGVSIGIQDSVDQLLRKIETPKSTPAISASR
jgi:hypothetical protein